MIDTKYGDNIASHIDDIIYGDEYTFKDDNGWTFLY